MCADCPDATADPEPVAAHNLLLVLLPDSRVVGIRSDRGRPEHFASDEARDAWIKTAAAVAYDTKLALEKGTLKVENCDDDLVVIDPLITEEEKNELRLERQLGWCTFSFWARRFARCWLIRY